MKPPSTWIHWPGRRVESPPSTLQRFSTPRRYSYSAMEIIRNHIHVTQEKIDGNHSRKAHHTHRVAASFAQVSKGNVGVMRSRDLKILTQRLANE